MVEEIIMLGSIWSIIICGRWGRKDEVLGWVFMFKRILYVYVLFY